MVPRPARARQPVRPRCASPCKQSAPHCAPCWPANIVPDQPAVALDLTPSSAAAPDVPDGFLLKCTLRLTHGHARVPGSRRCSRGPSGITSRAGATSATRRSRRPRRPPTQPASSRARRTATRPWCFAGRDCDACLSEGKTVTISMWACCCTHEMSVQVVLSKFNQRFSARLRHRYNTGKFVARRPCPAAQPLRAQT